MSASAIIQALNGNSGGMCKCPLHDDSTASLHVSEGNDGKILVYCHAGCPQNELVAWCKSRGLWPDRKFLDRKESKMLEWQRKQEQEQNERDRLHNAWAVIYAAQRANADRGPLQRYLRGRGIGQVPASAMLLPPQDADSPLLEKGVFKGFPAMVFAVGSEHGLQGAHATFLSRDGSTKLNVDRPKKLFGPVKGAYVVLREPESDRPLIVGEGIESTLSASQLAGGLPAISALNAGNMPSIALPPCGEVIIAADNDEKGREAAEKLAQRLAPDHTVRIAVPEFVGEDWNDVLRNDGAQPGLLGRLKRDILEAPLYKATPSGNDALTMAEFMALDIPPLSFLVKPILVMPGMTMLTARAGGGKTRQALSLSYSCATGATLLDWTVNAPCKVLYVDAELSPENMRDWLTRLGPASDNLKVLSDKRNYRAGLPRVTLETQEGRDYIAREIERHDARLVVLDSLMTLVPPQLVQGKLAEDLWPSVNGWISDRKRQGRHMLLLHHDNKSGSQYGSVLKEIEFDLIMQMETKPELSGNGRYAFKLSFNKPRHLSAAEAQSRIITVNDTGPIEWQLGEQAANEAPARQRERDHEIIDLHRQDWSLRKIAGKVGLAKSQVSRIIERETVNCPVVPFPCTKGTTGQS